MALAAAVGLSAAGTAAFAADEGDDEERSPEPAVGKVDSHEQQVDDLTTLTPEDLANALVGEDTGITITGASYTGADEAGGLASGFSGVFQVDGGVVLSSGAVAGEESNLYGPNESESWTTSFGTPGDERLDELTAPNTTGDAAVLEVQFVPETDAVDFRYVFGSDEYNEYVDTEFHDVFAFFVNDQNCALIDGDPVTVNTINNDVNSDLYVDNDLAAGRSHHTELDGFTVPLTCSAEVTADEENTLVLAIADTSDTAFDSTVLIEGGSLRSNNPPVADDQDVETEVDTAVDITLTATDPDGDELTFAIDGDPANGTLEGDAPDVTYVPEEGFTGTDEFTFTASDGSLTSNVATVTVTVAEPEPTPTPTPEPTEEPTPDPTPEPTEEPTPDPTDDPDDDEELPDTGAGMSTLFGAGAVLVAAGLGALLMTRRRLTGQDV